MKVILRLLVVAIILVGIGWIVLSFVQFPGNVNNLKTLHEKNYQAITQINVNFIETISSTSYNLTEFKTESDEYIFVTEQLKNKFSSIVIKDGFSWDEEKEIKTEMNKVFKIEKELKNYLSSLTIYLSSSEVHSETAQNMINNSVNKFTEITAKYNLFNQKLLTFEKTQSE